MTDSVQGVNGSNERYVEIWNLVFMQNERMQDRSLQTLSAKHVDTGAGLERICAILQSKNSNYETDLFMPIIKQIAEMTKTPYSPCEKGVPHRVIADHIRALTFTIADGATPGNDGRGYVIRRILRRASRYAFNLGMKQPFLYKLSAIVVGEMRNAYPELEERCEFVQQVIKSEEKRFLNTLELGTDKLNKVFEDVKKKKQEVVQGEHRFYVPRYLWISERSYRDYSC